MDAHRHTIVSRCGHWAYALCERPLIGCPTCHGKGIQHADVVCYACHQAARLLYRQQ